MTAQQLDWSGRAATLEMPPNPKPLSRNEAAMAQAQAAPQRRKESLALAQQNPRLARELRIGRPDIPHQYDDGGLVDINSVPASVFVNELGLSQEQANKIVETRKELGKFLHPDDLVNLANIDMDTYDRIRNHLIII